MTALKAYLHSPDSFSALDSLVKCEEEKGKGMSKSGREPCSGCSRIPVRKLGSYGAVRERKRESARAGARARAGRRSRQELGLSIRLNWAGLV